MQLTRRQPRRVFRPHRDWLVLDFVLAAIGLAFLAVALTGLFVAVSATSDLIGIGAACGRAPCAHSGTLVDRQRTDLPGGGLWGVGATVDYCLLTLDLDVGRRQAALPGQVCPRLRVPSLVSVYIWRGTIVTVLTSAGSFDTFQHPSYSLVAGLLWMVALLPFGLCVALIEIDVAHHRPVWKTHRRGLHLRRSG